MSESIIRVDNISNLSNDKLQIDLLNSNISYNNNVVGKIGNGYGGFKGNVIQVVSTTLSAFFSTTTGAGNFTNITGLSVDITPVYSTSKILLIGNVTGASANQLFLRFTRNGTAIGVGDASASELRVSMGELYNDGAAYGLKNASMNFLDSPSSTELQTYQIQATAGATILYINRSTGSAGTNSYARSISSITVMEIQQ